MLLASSFNDGSAETSERREYRGSKRSKDEQEDQCLTIVDRLCFEGSLKQCVEQCFKHPIQSSLIYYSISFNMLITQFLFEVLEELD